MPVQYGIEGKVVALTGAASGIGFATYRNGFTYELSFLLTSVLERNFWHRKVCNFQ